MRSQPYRDKKFTEIERKLAPELRRAGEHLVARRVYGRRFGAFPQTVIARFRNKIRKPAYVQPAAPIVDGVRMRWENGRLVPRVIDKAGDRVRRGLPGEA